MSGRDLSGPARRAIVAALLNDPGVAALVGGRVYDYVSAAPTYPFLRCTTATVTPWEATGAVRGGSSLMQVDAFTKDYGRTVVEQLVAAVVVTLDETELDLDGATLLSLQWRQTRILDDPADQSIAHGVVEFEVIAAQ